MRLSEFCKNELQAQYSITYQAQYIAKKCILTTTTNKQTNKQKHYLVIFGSECPLQCPDMLWLIICAYTSLDQCLSLFLSEYIFSCSAMF